jgi:hypothetical protein
MCHVIANRSVQLDQRDESADDNRERGSEPQREHHTRRSQTNGRRSRAERAREEGRDGRTRGGVVAAGPRSRTILTFRDGAIARNRTRL